MARQWQSWKTKDGISWDSFKTWKEMLETRAGNWPTESRTEQTVDVSFQGQNTHLLTKSFTFRYHQMCFVVDNVSVCKSSTSQEQHSYHAHGQITNATYNSHSDTIHILIGMWWNDSRTVGGLGKIERKQEIKEWSHPYYQQKHQHIHHCHKPFSSS